MIENDEVQATSAGRSRGTTQPMTVVRPAADSIGGVPITYVHTPSYHPTRWEFVNRVLDIVENVSGGHAGLLQRVFNYLMFGGFAAIVNLVLFTVFYYVVPMPIDHRIHFAVAFALATEISIMTNFVPQDLVTFRHLAGHSRSWFMRCLRFHMTSIGGVIVTAVVSFSLHEYLGLNAT
ncbi:MAG TPA: GtrA family protein, partial [Ktedonobacterales bacterium]